MTYFITNLAGIIAGILLGTFISRFLYNKKKYEDKSPKKRGLINIKYNIGDTSRDYEIEVEQIESSYDLHKLKFIKINGDYIENPKTLKYIKESFNNSWFLESKIDWLEKTVSEERREKIEKILK